MNDRAYTIKTRQKLDASKWSFTKYTEYNIIKRNKQRKKEKHISEIEIENESKKLMLVAVLNIPSIEKIAWLFDRLYWSGIGINKGYIQCSVACRLSTKEKGTQINSI